MKEPTACPVQRLKEDTATCILMKRHSEKTKVLTFLIENDF